MQKYHLIDLAQIPDHYTTLVDQAYGLWSDTYKPILEKSGEKLNPDTFWRTKILAVIEENFNIVGIHLYNSFHLSCMTMTLQGYLAQFPVDKIEELRAQKLPQVMSCEYLTVSPKYRGKNSSVSWGEVIVGLAAQVLLHSPWDVMVGISRTDYKVDQMALAIGAKDNGVTERHQVTCKVMTADRSQIMPHKDPMTRKIINNLWSEIKNHTQIINPTALQKAG